MSDGIDLDALEQLANWTKNAPPHQRESADKAFAEKVDAPTVLALIARVRESTTGVKLPEMPWRCFHCDETFTDREGAAEHFGTSLLQEPGCQIDIAKYRSMEELVRRSSAEDTDLHREIAQIQGGHATALRREEEKGYARGLRDAELLTRDDAHAREVPTTIASEPIYQYRMADGSWIDQSRQSYLYNQEHAADQTRIVYPPSAFGKLALDLAAHPVVAMLIEVARCAHLALDDSEEQVGADGRCHVLDGGSFDSLSQSLDTLDELPDDRPGYTMGPAQKAEWALRGSATEVSGSGDRGLDPARTEIRTHMRAAGLGALLSELYAKVGGLWDVDLRERVRHALNEQESALCASSQQVGTFTAPEAPAAGAAKGEIKVTPAMRGWLEHIDRGGKIRRSERFVTGPYTTSGRGGLTWVMVEKLEDAGLIVWEQDEPLGTIRHVKACLTDAGRTAIVTKNARGRNG